MSETTTHYDAIIIGFGKGGKTLAATLAARGQSVALVEKSASMYGGTCINVACIPTKSLVHRAAQSAVAGGTWEERQERYAQAIARGSPGGPPDRRESLRDEELEAIDQPLEVKSE